MLSQGTSKNQWSENFFPQMPNHQEYLLQNLTYPKETDFLMLVLYNWLFAKMNFDEVTSTQKYLFKFRFKLLPVHMFKTEMALLLKQE